MERVVDPANLERAWRQVKGNRGAPGPDGMTVSQFETWARANWPTVRQQLLDGTYRPAPVRRKTIPKPGGKGDRLLGIPNVLDRLIQHQRRWGTTKDTKSTKGSENKTLDAIFQFGHVEVDQ
jgi:RNA-directed DNA polymerase